MLTVYTARDTFMWERHYEDWRPRMTLADAAPSWWEEGPASVAWHNGKRAADLGAPLGDADTLHFAAVPGFEGAAIAKFIGLLLVSTVVSFVLQALLAPTLPSRKRDEEASAQFGFSGIRNSVGEGQPIGVGFGRLRIGGQIINRFTVVRNIPAETDLWILISLGEGPFEEIAGQTVDTLGEEPFESGHPERPIPAGIQINGNDARNYDGVQVWVRMGSNEQTAIPGFEFAASQKSVGSAALTAETVTGLNNSALVIATLDDPDNWPNEDVVWDEHGFAFDLTDDDYDAFDVVLDFPQGLHTVQADSTIGTAQFWLWIRYIELDSLGNPITTGGAWGDGYVRLKPETPLIASQRGRFQYQWSHPFRDPQTYTAPTGGKALENPLGAGYGEITNFNVPTEWTDADPQQVTAITIEGWVWIAAGSVGTTRRGVVSWWRDSTVQGVSLHVRELEYDVGGTPTTFLVPEVWIGNVLTTFEFREPSTFGFAPTYPLQYETWHHVAMTYQVNQSSFDERVRIYVDGELAMENVDQIEFGISFPPPGASATRIRLMDSNSASIGKLTGLLDEVNIYKRELFIPEIAARYNDGAGLYGSTDPDLIVGYHFESVSDPSPDYSGNGNDLSLLPSTADIHAGLSDGHVVTQGGGGAKRSTYRVECLRINVDSTNARVADDAEWLYLIGKVDEQFSYPNEALLGIKIRATEQLNTSEPTVTTLCKLLRAQVWDGTSVTSPTIALSWSQNPAWQMLAMARDRRWGLGQHFADLRKIDLPAFLAFATRCDEIVYDGRDRVAADPAAGGDGWATITYDSTVTDPDTSVVRGGLLIAFTSTPIPSHWLAGGFVRLSGMPTPGDYPGVVTADINSAANEGYEIYQIVQDAGAKQVRIYWDGDTAPWADGASLATIISPDDVYGTIEGAERRFTSNIYWDTAGNAWDRLVHLAGIGWGAPVISGNKLSVRYEAPRLAVGLLTMANIVDRRFSLTYEGTSQRANHMDADFQDERRNYENSTLPQDDPEIENVALFEDYRVAPPIALQGVTRRSQVQRELLFRLGVNREVKRVGKATLSADSLPLEVGDRVYLAHDIVPRGRSGRVMADSASTTTFTADRDLTLAAATTYLVTMRNSVNDTLETRTVSTAAGSYPSGSTVTVSAAFSWTPTKDDVYILYEQGSELSVVIGRMRRNADLTTDVEFTEYVESILSPDADAEDLAFALDDDNAPVGDRTAPDNVGGLTVVETLTPRSATVLDIAWRHADRTLAVVAHTVVYVSLDSGPLEQIATVRGNATSAQVTLARARAGSQARVVVQAVSYGGASLAPETCTARTLTLEGLSVPVLSVPPDPPTGVAAAFVDGDKALYSWTLPEGGESLVVECRRGGWLCAPLVFRSERGATSFGPTRDWAGATGGTGEPALVFRTVDAQGRYSAEARLAAFSPSPDIESFPTSFTDDEWSDFGDGWVIDSPAGSEPNGALSGLQRRTDGSLEFSGSNLTGTYTIAQIPDTELLGQRLRDAYLEAVVEAEQIHPKTWSGGLHAWGAAGALRWTWEGPLWLLRGETPNVSLILQARVNLTGLPDGWTAWREFRPTKARIAAAQFRVSVTRPTTDYQIRVHRLATRIRAVAVSTQDRSDVRAMLQREILDG